MAENQEPSTDVGEDTQKIAGETRRSVDPVFSWAWSKDPMTAASVRLYLILISLSLFSATLQGFLGRLLLAFGCAHPTGFRELHCGLPAANYWSTYATIVAVPIVMALVLALLRKNRLGQNLLVLSFTLPIFAVFYVIAF